MASMIRPSLMRQSLARAALKPTVVGQVSPFSTVISKPKAALSRQAFRNTFAKDNKGSVRVAAFHASGRQAILPPGPQVIDGTANDAARVPPPSPSHGSYHWTFERLISIGLIPLTITPFVSGSLNPATDALFCAALILHSHIGFESCIIDYFPPRRVPKTRMFFDWSLRIATVLTAVGLYEFETNDVGVTEAVKRIWHA